MFTTTVYEDALAEQRRILDHWATISMASSEPGIHLVIGASILRNPAGAFLVVPTVGWQSMADASIFGTSTTTLPADPDQELADLCASEVDADARLTSRLVAQYCGPTLGSTGA